MPIDNDSIMLAINEVGESVNSLQPTLLDYIVDGISLIASFATLYALYLAIRDFKTVKKAVSDALSTNNKQIQNNLHVMTLTEACSSSDIIIEEISHALYGSACVRLQRLNEAVIEMMENNTYVDKNKLSDYQKRVSSDINSLHILAVKPDTDIYVNNILLNIQRIHDELKKAESKQTNILKGQ